MKKILTTGMSAALVVLLSACASSSPDVIQRGDTQRMAVVEDAVVLSVRTVTVDGSQSGVGAVVCGVVGAVGGSAASGVNREGQVLGLLAGVAGAAAGNAIERMSTREEAVEVLVQLANGQRRAIVQAKGSQALEPGDAVILVTSGGKVRITKAPKVVPATPMNSVNPANPVNQVNQ